MKVCHNCSTEVSADSKFCTSCGTQLGEGTSDQVTQAKEEASATAEIASATNEYAEQGKELAKGYWDHLVHMFKSPLRHGKTEGEGNFVNGIITLVLFSLFIPLTFYFGLRSLASSMGFGGAGFSEYVPFGSIFFKPFIFILLFVAIASAIIFAVAKPGLSNLNFKAVVGKFGALMVVPTTIILLSLLVVVLNMFSVFGYVFILGLAGMFIAATVTIYSFANTTSKGIDGFYGALIFNIGAFLYFQIVSENLIINQLLDEMSYF